MHRKNSDKSVLILRQDASTLTNEHQPTLPRGRGLRSFCVF